MSEKFNKPSRSDIAEYLVKCKNYDDFTADGFADKFWHYYESKGWKVGKTPMKDWKAAIRTWELNNKKNDTYQQINSTPSGTSINRTNAIKGW